MGSGAWPFLVRGLNCLVNSVNERDLYLLNSNYYLKRNFKLLFHDDDLKFFLHINSNLTITS